MTMTPEKTEQALERVHERVESRAGRRRAAAAVTALVIVVAVAAPIAWQLRRSDAVPPTDQPGGSNYSGETTHVSEEPLDVVAVGPDTVWATSSEVNDYAQIIQIAADGTTSSHRVPGPVISLLPTSGSVWLSTGTYLQELHPDGTLGPRIDDIGWATAAHDGVIWGLSGPTSIAGYDSSTSAAIAPIDLGLSGNEYVVGGVQILGEDLVVLAATDSGGRLILVNPDRGTLTTLGVTPSATSYFTVVGEEVWVPRWNADQTTFDRFSRGGPLASVRVDGQVTPIGTTRDLLWAIGDSSGTYHIRGFRLDSGVQVTSIALPETPALDGSGAVDPDTGVVAVGSGGGSITIARP